VLSAERALALAGLCIACESGPVAQPAADVPKAAVVSSSADAANADAAAVPDAAFVPSPSAPAPAVSKPRAPRALKAREAPRALAPIAAPRGGGLKALGEKVAVVGAVRALGGGTLLSYREADSETLQLALLEGSPARPKHSVATGLACEPDESCSATFVAHDLGGLTLLLVALAGEGTRGQGHFRTSQAELRTLTADGFGHATKLMSAVSSETAHGRTSEEVLLFWVDSDGQQPPEVLLRRHEESPGTLMGTQMLPGWDRRKYELFSFDSASNGYAKLELSPEAADPLLEMLTRGRPFGTF
jgi:hypothetical protein